jgi:hypothetical protein
MVNHIGDDPETGWYAFEARSAGQPRDCVIEWQADDNVFLEPCTGDTYPPDGEGLNQFPVEIEGGKVVIDVNAAAREAEEEEQQDATTTSVIVSGDEAPGRRGRGARSGRRVTRVAPCPTPCASDVVCVGCRGPDRGTDEETSTQASRKPLIMAIMASGGRGRS